MKDGRTKEVRTWKVHCGNSPRYLSWRHMVGRQPVRRVHWVRRSAVRCDFSEMTHVRTAYTIVAWIGI